MALTKVTDSIIDFDSLEILTSASDTGVDLTLNGNKSSNGAVGSLIFENNTDSVAMIRASRVGGNNDAADLGFYTQANGGSNTERMTITSDGTLKLLNTDALRISNMNALGQTVSGAMHIIGHNAHVDSSTANVVKAIASSWYPSFIKMYYSDGITFHTNTTTQATAGDTLLSGTGSNNLEKLRIDNYALHSGGMMRTSGWYNNNNGYSTNQALETGTTGSYSYVLSYNRTSSGYGGLMLSGDTVRFQTAGNQRLIVDDGATYPYTDNVYDLGTSAFRYDDIYATNTTIQTSDRNEKNTITDTDLGLDFINRLSPKSYIFNGGTRTHYGLIAQDVEDVLVDISKPTSEFAGFIKNQKYRQVGEEVTEEDGVIVSEPTQEEVEGEYTYGLRYSEFISPMIKAIQELKAENDSLKTRIETLENA
tara:strand:- start:27 stop:1292 length:1266 start_codon:yes stop_codon:yes gene_type:complete